MPTVCKTRHRASRRRRSFLRHARRLGARTGPSGRGERSCLIVGLLPPDTARRCAMFSLPAIPVIGDLIRYTVGPLFGAALVPLASKGMVSHLPRPDRFSKR